MKEGAPWGRKAFFSVNPLSEDRLNSLNKLVSETLLKLYPTPYIGINTIYTTTMGY